MRMYVRRMRLKAVLVMVYAMMGLGTGTGAAVEPPPNVPAEVRWDAGTGTIGLSYNGKAILTGAVVANDEVGKRVAADIRFEPQDARGDRDTIEQRLAFTVTDPKEGVELVLRGTVTGSEEAFPAELGGAAQKRFACVRTSVGLSHSLRNNAVYDRRWDWVLFAPADGTTRVMPTSDGKQREFAWTSRGARLELVFRPRFYQKHKRLSHFEPWTYKVWRDSVTGYCTWWPYRHGFSQKVLDDILDVFSEKHLPDFGYRYLQIDDCFQTGGASPKGFLNWNGKFPDGPEYFVKKVRSAGMEPGVWVFCVMYDSDPVVREMAKQHPEWFVRNEAGKVKRVVNPWSGAGLYALDTTNRDAVEALIRPTYRGLKKLGFDYVKIDGAGDLVDWGYRRSETYFEDKGVDSGGALRAFYRAAREELGDDVYILTCWGVLPELIGVADGCRLATDGFRASSFQGFSSWEGVVWRNDPDHCDVLPVGSESQPVMKTFAVADAPIDTIVRPGVIAMAGGVLLLSDKADVYRDDSNLEGAKRSSPVLFTVPGQLTDYTPRGENWSFKKHFRGYVRGGGGEAEWWLQEIDRPFDHWSVLARFNWGKKELKGKRTTAPARDIRFADLGLYDDREYVVFEFWTQKYLGKFKDSFPAPAMDTNDGMDVFAIREVREHPWVLSTTRHLSQGGVSLSDVKWDAGTRTLSGRSAMVVGDPYVLTVHVPGGFRVKSAEFGDEKAESKHQEATATVRIVPSATKTVTWEMAL